MFLFINHDFIFKGLNLNSNFYHLIKFGMKIVAIFAVISLLGCHRAHTTMNFNDEDETKLPKYVNGTSDQAIADFNKLIRKQSVRIMTRGQDYLISIPSSFLFMEHSPKIIWKSHALLNDISCFLKEFRKIEVHVRASSDAYRSAQRDEALTNLRAREIASYLWSRGIDSRFIFSEGLGSNHPIVSYLSNADKSMNSRIEIIFRQALI